MAMPNKLQRALESVADRVRHGESSLRLIQRGPRGRPSLAHPPNWRPESHRGFEAVVCVEGEMVIVGAFRIHTLRAGDALVVPPGAWHYESYQKRNAPYKAFWLIDGQELFHGGFAIHRPRAFRAIEAGCISSVTLPPLLLDEIAREIEERPPGWRIKVRLMLAGLIVDYSRGLAEKRGDWKPATFDPIQSAKRIVETRFREPLQIKTVAAELGLSPNYLSQRFKEAHGASFKRYLNFLRLHHARLLLRSGWSVKKAAAASGFAHASYFCRLFKQLCQSTPRAVTGRGPRRATVP